MVKERKSTLQEQEKVKTRRIQKPSHQRGTGNLSATSPKLSFEEGCGLWNM